MNMRKPRLSDKQLKALATGQAIRQIVCADSIANRFFEPHLRQKMRELCDEQMHILGYESLTEHRERTRSLWDIEETYKLSNNQANKLFRYKRIDRN